MRECSVQERQPAACFALTSAPLLVPHLQVTWNRIRNNCRDQYVKLTAQKFMDPKTDVAVSSCASLSFFCSRFHVPLAFVCTCSLCASTRACLSQDIEKELGALNEEIVKQFQELY